jgi:hypothetical protein
VFAVAASMVNAALHALLDDWRFAPFVIAPAGVAAISYIGQRFFRGAQGQRHRADDRRTELSTACIAR